VQGLKPQMVLDDLDFLLDRLRAQPEKLKQFGQRMVPHFDMVGHRPSFVGERETAILFVIHEPLRRSGLYKQVTPGGVYRDRPLGLRCAKHSCNVQTYQTARLMASLSRLLTPSAPV